MRKRIILCVGAIATAFALGVGTAAFTAERHPEIRAGMRALRNAEGHLGRAAIDYGGHRVKALELIRSAQNELQAALAWDAAQEKK
jgi:hypothetical protein